MEEQLRKLFKRLEKVEDLLGHPEVHADQKQYRDLAQEHAHLTKLKEHWDRILSCRKQLEENRSLQSVETDPAFLEVIKEEIGTLVLLCASAEQQLESLLIPPDLNDSRNIILELRAGTGGDEAALFVGDCVRMYKLYAEKKGWKYEPFSCAPSELGGYKEYVMILSGFNVHRLIQYEAGTHRVQRVPKTETQGRVHTSAITIAVLIEPDEHEKVSLDERDLRIDTYRASGAGGQHVNVTDSAVRITHIPTGVVVSCQEERSQHKNKDKAMRLLSARIAEEQRRRADQEVASLRSSQVGSGDRSERIRTYNFSQNRVTDHRVNLTLYKLNLVMEGDLDEFTEALVAYFHQQKLASIGLVDETIR